MEHPFLECIDWDIARLGCLRPPLIPPDDEVNAANPHEIGSFRRYETMAVTVSY